MMIDFTGVYKNMSDNNPQIDSVVVNMLNKVNEIGFEGFQNIIALGRWPDGTRLTPEESALAMQSLIIYEHQNIPLSERTGFIHKNQCDS